MELSIALNRYDRHIPFFNQTIAPPECLKLKVYEVGEILRLMVMRRELKINYPGLRRQSRKLFWDVYEVAQSFYGASHYFLMICARNALERQKNALGTNPWTDGLATTKKNLDQFINYSYDH